MINIDPLNQISNNPVAYQTYHTNSASDFSAILREQMNQPTTMEGIFAQAAEKYQVPVNLLKAVAKAESNFDPKAVSHCGASGIMQLMPQTAASLGVTDVFDPEQNIMGGAKYLRQMLDRYDGDVKLTLAAYNAGSGNVAKYGGIPPFEETQNYVKKVMQYAGEEIYAEGTYSKGFYANGAAANPYQSIYDEILGFEEYTQEDYRLFAEYLKLSLLSHWQADQSQNLVANRIVSMINTIENGQMLMSQQQLL